jgi:hypothetical protein
MNAVALPEMKETGAEELRRIVSVLDHTTEGALDPFTAEELLRIVRACWTSAWDIVLDELTLAERRYAAKHGALSVSCTKRLDREIGK